MFANEIQHGGSHYKKHKIQVWDFILANGIGYMEGSAIKYLCRWQDKGGVQDLKKAIHFIQRLIEEEESIPKIDKNLIQQESKPDWRENTVAADPRNYRLINGAIHETGVPPPRRIFTGDLYNNGRIHWGRD